MLRRRTQLFLGKEHMELIIVIVTGVDQVKNKTVRTPNLTSAQFKLEFIARRSLLASFLL